MKFNTILILFLSVFMFSSCSQIREVTEELAGEITEYNDEYTFQTDRMTGDNYFEQIEDYMRSNDWLLTDDNQSSIVFEQTDGVYEENTTSRYVYGTAEFYHNEREQTIELYLDLEGNYNYGTKTNSLEIYNNLRDYLYE